MKKHIFIIFLGLLFTLTAMDANAKSDIDLGCKIKESSQIEKTLTFDRSRDRVLEIDNFFGGIIVTGTDSDSIKLKAVKTIFGKTKARIQQAKEEVKLDITSKNGVVRIYVDVPYRDKHNDRGWEKKYGYVVEYDFEIQVPRKTAVKLETASNGDIRVSNIVGRCEIGHANGQVAVTQLTGDFDIHTANGKIVMDGIDGSGKARTANGKVDVRFTRNPKSDCTFHTVNGRVIVKFQPKLAADFYLKTFQGKILSDFPFSYKKLPAAEGKRKNGRFVYKSDDAQAIRIGDGGPVIRMDTLNGNLIIAKGE